MHSHSTIPQVGFEREKDRKLVERKSKNDKRRRRGGGNRRVGWTEGGKRKNLVELK